MDGEFDFDEECELLEQECELYSGVGTAALTPAGARHDGNVIRPPVVNNLIEEHDTMAPSRQHLPVGVNAFLITD
jgi:hypothetical protein